MARSNRPLIALAGLFSLTAISLQAAPTPAASPSPSPASQKQTQSDGQKSTPEPQKSPLAKSDEHKHHHKAPPKDEYWKARKKLDETHSHDRGSLSKNYQRWQKMSPEERKFFRSREAFERKWINKQIDDAIQKSGLKLTPDQRQKFALRYMQERRKIERHLHKEIGEKRKLMVDKMVGKLKKEFSESPQAEKPEKP